MTRHVPLALPVALVLGLALGARGVPIAGALVACALAALVATALWRHGRIGLALGVAAVAIACAGAAWGTARVAAMAPQPVTRFGQVQALVAVTGFPVRGDHSTRMPVQVLQIPGRGAPARGDGLLMDLPLRVTPPDVGQVVRVQGRLGPAAGGTSPGWWAAWVRRQHVAARLRATTWRAAGWRGGVSGSRDALRRWAHANVAAGLSGDVAALVTGMALGGGDGLSEQAATRMRDSGLWHLLAVSGQNVAVIGIGVMIALGAAGVARLRRVAMAGAAMLAYCLACDGGASVLRAGLMGAIGVAADLRGGGRAPWNALLVTLAGMLALDPLAIGDPGLQLSFAAVAGLFAVAPPLAQWARGVMPGRVADLMGQSAGAGLATAPVLAVGFGSLSVVGLLANLVAVPVAGPVVVVAMLGVGGNALWAPLGEALASLAAVGAWVILAVATMAASVPGAVQQVPAWTAVPLALLAAVPPMMWWWLRRVPRALPEGTVRVSARTPVAVACAGVAAWLLVPLLPACAPAPPSTGPGLRMLDVGQGSAVALRDGPRVHVLVDAGPPGSPPPVTAALDAMGAGVVGVVVVSHGSSDHAGGLGALIDDGRVRQLLLPATDSDAALVRDAVRRARRSGVTVGWADAGTEVAAGPWRVRVIGPAGQRTPGDDPNMSSLVVHSQAPGLSALVPGDAESPVLARLPLPAVDVLQVPHHGSEDPGLPAVLERTRPVAALVSAGAGNQFGHPRAPTLAALAASGARVLRTDRGGDIDVSPTAGGIVVSRG